MSSKKDYINLIRWSCIIDSFTNFYFMRSIVLYLLAQNVTPWIAVSIPIVLEFARLISRGFSFLVKLALKVDYKKYHIFHLIAFLLLGLIISQCRSVYTIYGFTIISGILSGIKYSSITKLNTSNKDYESYCFIEEERSQVIGGTLGLIISQFIFDYNKKIYIIGYIFLIIVGTLLSSLLNNVKTNDVMTPISQEKELTKNDKKSTIIITSLFGILAGCWCMGLGGFTELAPLISNKIGYLEAVYTILEIILLCIITGNILKKVKEKGKLLLVETIIASLDVLCLFIAAITLSWQGLFISYILTAFTSTMGDPIWGSIISAYSTNNRKKYVLVNKVYFIVRSIFTIITWLICRECVIRGVDSFKYLSLILIFIIAIVYIISNKLNKKIFGRSI